jgi:formyltetrahydrofolate-dependent phosphoribosylglycinamide formyltransferase
MDFVVLSSSRGTTFQAVINAMQHDSLTARCLGLIADREDRGCVAKARSAEIPVLIIERVKGEERQEYDRKVDTTIQTLIERADGRGQNTIIACLGWMFIFSPWFVQKWHRRILNVHPSLLPKYPGGHAVDDALNAGDAETGMSIHWIDEGVDTGEILVQKKCSIEKEDTVETLKERIQELEKEWYPKVLQKLHEEEES